MAGQFVRQRRDILLHNEKVQGRIIIGNGLLHNAFCIRNSNFLSDFLPITAFPRKKHWVTNKFIRFHRYICQTGYIEGNYGFSNTIPRTLSRDGGVGERC